MIDERETVVLWFKRDLRTNDHAPLASLANFRGTVIPLYIVEPEYWEHNDCSFMQWHFLRDSLLELNNELIKYGLPLIYRSGKATEVVEDIAKMYNLKSIIAHEETGNEWTYKRDIEVKKWAENRNVKFKEHPTNGVFRKLNSRDGWKAKRARRMSKGLHEKPAKLGYPSNLEPGEIPVTPVKFKNQNDAGNLQGGSVAAHEVLKSFIEERHKGYSKSISSPLTAEVHSSRLSAHLTWGTISSREIVHRIKAVRDLAHENPKLVNKGDLAAFCSRLAWRCHFIQKLEDQPSIEHACMHGAFEDVRPKHGNQNMLKAWSVGSTGFPMVDACMRFLRHNGWINFRMRAMLSSFASYNLWLDWREFGPHLARSFIDYEPGIHFSQLQMQSGVTGINTWRIYNPVKQSVDNDPEGIFIRRWVPELKNVQLNHIHEPWKMDVCTQKKTKCTIGEDYPEPIIDHQTSGREARLKLGQVAKSDGYAETKKKVLTKHGSRSSRRRSGKRNEPSKQLDLLKINQIKNISKKN